MPRALRYLRYAFTAFCGLVAVALCVSWIRSYWRMDMFSVPLPRATELSVITVQGRNLFMVEQSRVQGSGFEFNSVPINAFNSELIASDIPDDYLGVREMQDTHLVAAPYWLLVMFGVAAATLPWIPFTRFSLRTLLIATTLVAVVLGLLVWLLR